LLNICLAASLISARMARIWDTHHHGGASGKTDGLAALISKIVEVMSRPRQN
jgi:hypothetical protein